MEFFGDLIVTDGKISGTAGLSSGTAGYDGTKPLPQPVLTCDQWSFVALTLHQFHRQRSKCEFIK